MVELEDNLPEQEAQPAPVNGGLVQLIPLSVVPGMAVEEHHGPVTVHLIKEIKSREAGGLAIFAHRFMAEAHAVARAHVASRGGNALLSYSVNECVIREPRRNEVLRPAARAECSRRTAGVRHHLHQRRRRVSSSSERFNIMSSSQHTASDVMDCRAVALRL